MADQQPIRKNVDVSMRSGANADGFAESVQVMDCNNVELLPDASGVRSRRGSVVVGKYAPYLSGDNKNRVAIVVETRPPNISDGTWMALKVDTSSNNAIVDMATFKPRTNLPSDTGESFLSFEKETYVVGYGQSVTLTVYRSGALSTSVTVAYATSNGTATAGVDYTAASGTLSFAAGETAKTITVATTNAGQTSDLVATMTLSTPTGGAIIENPSVANIRISTGYALVNCPSTATTGSGTSTSPCAVMFWDQGTNECTAHYLTGFYGYEQSGGAYYTPMVVGPDTVAFISTYDGLNRINLYSISQMRLDGGAYSKGATSISAAVKTTPYAIVPMPSGAANYWMWAPYNTSLFFVLTESAVIGITMSGSIYSNYTVTNPYTGSSYFHTVVGAESTMRLPVDSAGYILGPTYNATSAAYGLLRINPFTGVVASSLTEQAKNTTPMVALKSGRVILYQTMMPATDDVTTYSADLQTAYPGDSPFGSYTVNSPPSIILASSTGRFVCRTNDSELWLVYMSGDNLLKKYGCGTIGIANPRFTSGGWYTSTRFVWLKNDGSGGTPCINMTDVAGASATLVSTKLINTDRYSCYDYDTQFATISKMCLCDPFWFNPREVQGSLA